MMDFAERVVKLVPEGAYSMLGKAQALEAAGREIIHLEIGQPDVPTFENIAQAGIRAIEQGFPDFVWEPWSALLAPAHTPPAAVASLQSAMQQALAAADFREGLANLGFDPIDEDPKAFPALLREETAMFRRLVGRIGLRIER